jgi:hypothetical protein
MNWPIVRFLGLKVMCLLLGSTKLELWPRTFGHEVGVAQLLVDVVPDAEGGAHARFLLLSLADLQSLLDSGWEVVWQNCVDN